MGGVPIVGVDSIKYLKLQVPVQVLSSISLPIIITEINVLSSQELSLGGVLQVISVFEAEIT